MGAAAAVPAGGGVGGGGGGGVAVGEARCTLKMIHSTVKNDYAVRQ
jgi:hypothetical protein